MKRSLPYIFLLAALLAAGGCSRLAGIFPSVHTSKRVAVINFQNLTGDPKNDYLEGAMGEYLTDYLANSGKINLCDPQDIMLSLEEIDNAESEDERYDRLQELGRRIDAEYLVVGSVSLLEDNFILAARLFSVSRGEVISGSAVEEACRRKYEIYYRAQNIGAFLARQLKARGALEEPEL